MSLSPPPGCLPPTVDQLNLTNLTVVKYCSTEIPSSKQLFADLPIGGIILMVILALFTATTVALYIEEIVFILRNFRKGTRKQKTIWILAFFPVYSTTGLLGCFVPRSGALVDMVAAVYFSTCLYNFGRLMVCYMGGPQRMWVLIEDKRLVHLNTPPCCCCCVCLPTPVFKRRLYFKITMLIMQCAIVRPILMFLAAVMWTNGSYQPGDMSPRNAFVYVTLINLLSSLSAMYGLMILRGILRPELEKKFAISGKIASLQLTLICSALPNLIIGALVTIDVIKCGPIFPSKARGEAIYHSFLVLMMLPFSLLGRKFYRRKCDGVNFAEAAPGRKVPNPINELATDDEEEIEQPAGAQEMVQFREAYINEAPSRRSKKQITLLAMNYNNNEDVVITSEPTTDDEGAAPSSERVSDEDEGAAPSSKRASDEYEGAAPSSERASDEYEGAAPSSERASDEDEDNEIENSVMFHPPVSNKQLTPTQMDMLLKQSGYCEVSV